MGLPSHYFPLQINQADWYEIKIPMKERDSGVHLGKILIWLYDNIDRSDWTLWDSEEFRTAYFNFRHAEDAMAFKLRWT